MKQLDLVIQNDAGLHARPAKTLVNLAKTFESKIMIQHGKRKVNAKSMISVLTLGVPQNGAISLEFDGADEEVAAAAIIEAVHSGLGEEIGAHSQEAAAPAAAAAPVEAPAQTNENIIQGVAAAPGIAIGPLFILQRGEIEIGDDAAVGDVSAETSHFEAACTKAQTEIAELRTQTVATAGAETAEIFDAHLAILTDLDLINDVTGQIQSGSSAANAWQQAYVSRADELKKLDNPELAARAADIKDVGDRVLVHLVGSSAQVFSLFPDHPIILLADDLTPSDTASLDKSRVLAICTAQGGPNSHTAILSRAFELPAVVGVGAQLLEMEPGTQVVVDGSAGTIDRAPSPEAIAAAKEQQAQLAAKRKLAQERAHDRATTVDGKHIEVVANVGGVEESQNAFKAGAEGVGLLRTEFLFLKRETPPTEDEQFDVYKGALEALQGQPVLMRTLDVGGDKQLPYFDLPHEENPFLGERGIRLCLNRPDVFRTQLRALLRSAEYGKLRIMFPMVSALHEWRAARALVEEIRAEVGAPKIEMGIMIEVPAAALLADKFAKEVDFFSIGTNDLTQYTLAVDRMHPTLAGQADGLDPSVLRLISMTVEAAHANGKWVGVCGELGADAQALPILLGLGVDELSVNVPAIPLVKAQIRTVQMDTAQQLAQQALACESAEQVRALVN